NVDDAPPNFSNDISDILTFQPPVSRYAYVIPNRVFPPPTETCWLVLYAAARPNPAMLPWLKELVDTPVSRRMAIWRPGIASPLAVSPGGPTGNEREAAVVTWHHILIGR